MTRLGSGDDPVGRPAHGHQRVLLGPVDQGAERAGRLEDVGQIERELPPGEHRRRRGVGRGEVAQPQRLGQVAAESSAVIAGPSGFQTGYEVPRQHPCASDLALVRREAVRRREIDQDHGAGTVLPPVPAVQAQL